MCGCRVPLCNIIMSSYVKQRPVWFENTEHTTLFSNISNVYTKRFLCHVLEMKACNKKKTKDTFQKNQHHSKNEIVGT